MGEIVNLDNILEENQMEVVTDSLFKYEPEREQNLKKIKKYLKTKREKLHLTKEYVSKELDITEDDIYSCENGIFFVPDKKIVDLLIYFYKTYEKKQSNEESNYDSNGFAKLEKIQDIIKYNREKLGLSQRDLDKKTKFRDGTMGNYENKKRYICPLGDRYILAKIFGIPYKQLCIDQEELNILDQHNNLYPNLYPNNLSIAMQGKGKGIPKIKDLKDEKEL